MNYNVSRWLTIIFCLLQFSNSSFPQTTYFIKYKDWIPSSEINRKISTKQFFNVTGPRVLSKSNFTAKHFAKNLGGNSIQLSHILKLTFTDAASATNFLQSAANDSTIQYVEQAHVYRIDSIPNDSLVSRQWALNKIKAFDAWNITQGADSVLIGIIDTGIDYLHPDLKNKIFINRGETGTDNSGKDKKSNGVDDDGNGFIDDYIGWDFTDEQAFPFDSSSGDYVGWDNNPMDENGHGTFIAGIVAAETNNGIGVAGAAPKIKILNCRAFDPSGNGAEDDVSAAILYAVKMGVKVINMSFGDSQYSNVLHDVIKYAYDRGVVLVASSGNSGSDEPHYPSGFSEVISVGSSTQDDGVAGFSNFGSSLDLVAPGENILTTAKGGGYSEVSGTSASAPFVSAAAGLILSLGNFSNEEVKQIIKSTADDIGIQGWDEQSGAGRLNLYRAVSVVAPSIIKFNSPQQDFATSLDTLTINATVLSAYFKNYSLYLGTGLNPTNWTSIIQNDVYQFSNKNIYNLNVSSMPDSVYCLRLHVNSTNGLSSEERINFYIEKKSPAAELNYAESAFYGNKTTVLASINTNQPCKVRLYFRRVGTANFNFVTLDDFSKNIQTVSYYHFGFIPTNLVEQNSSYEVYFEAENLAGLKSIIKNGSNNFIFNTTFDFSSSYETVVPYFLPAGSIYQNPVSITSNDSSEIFLRPFSNQSETYLYKLNNSGFNKIDSMNNRIVKDFGDFNKNGKKDLLTYFVYKGYIDEQITAGASKFNEPFADTTSFFWPVLAKDIDNDGKTEIMALDSDTSFVIYKINNDLSLTSQAHLINFTKDGSWNNNLDAPNAAIADIDNSGKNEIWMIDKDGDIFSYVINGSGNYQKGKSIATGLDGSSAMLTAGNYLGDGRKEIAVLLNSPEGTNTTPFYKLEIFRFDNDTLNVIYQQLIINPASEFSSSFTQTNNSVRFADIDNDGKDELILFAFPYSYILKFVNGENRIISYKENINSSSIFVGDLNKDGIPEVGFPTSNGISFSEFAESNSASAPINLAGYSIDLVSAKLFWQGNETKYYIYRGGDAQNLFLLDSTASTTYIDKKVKPDSTYFYSIKSFNSSKAISLSNYSGTIQVFVHDPAKIISAINNTPNSVVVKFSNRINNKIENLQAFLVINTGFPNSISAMDQFSYLLSFSKSFSSGSHQLTAANLNDFYGSPVPADTINFNVSIIAQQSNFYITSYKVIDPYTIMLEFNFPIDSTSALNKSNYAFSPENILTDIQIDHNDRRIIYLSLKGSKPVGSIGIEYTLKTSNLKSSIESGNIPITSGAGSYVVLSSNAENLSGVYVYPSPARINNEFGKITFANLPLSTKITIFNLNGKKINEIVTQNRSGGVDYNLRDVNGNQIGSGVYIYRIVRFNDQNQEVEEKIGKFAVIK